MFYSLKNRLIAFFVLLLVVSFGTVSLLLFSQSRAIIRSYIETSALEKMDEYGSFISMAALQVYDISSLVFNSEETKNWNSALTDPSLSEGERMLANISLSKFLTHAVNSYSGISSVSLYREEGLIVSEDNEVVWDRSFVQAPWYKDFMGRGRHWVSAHTDQVEIRRARPYQVLSLLLPVGVLEPSQAKTVMKVNVSEDFFLEPLSRIHLGETGTIFLLDGEGSPILSQELYESKKAALRQVEAIRQNTGGPTEGVVYLKSDQGDTDILVYKKLKQSGWLLMGLVPERDLYAQLYTLRTTVIIFSSFLLIAAILLATWLSVGITKPLSRLASAMRFVQTGDFALAESRIPEEKTVRNEVGFVVASFRNMVLQLRQHIKTEFELKLLRQQAEYKALLMQMNPHFLFNTLELLSSLSMQKRTDDSVRVIESLGKMLRFSLNSKEDLIPLAEELSCLRHYISILSIRFRERLDIQLEVEGKPEGRFIVKFLLQPLVENAVKYSFAGQAQAYVRIRVKVEGGQLRLMVADNGPGLPEGLAARLAEEATRSQFNDVLNNSGQIGLRNVLARCSLYYGSGFTYRIDSQPEQGTLIELCLPAGEGAKQSEEGAMPDVPGTDRGR